MSWICPKQTPILLFPQEYLHHNSPVHSFMHSGKIIKARSSDQRDQDGAQFHNVHLIRWGGWIVSTPANMAQPTANIRTAKNQTCVGHKHALSVQFHDIPDLSDLHLRKAWRYMYTFEISRSRYKSEFHFFHVTSQRGNRCEQELIKHAWMRVLAYLDIQVWICNDQRISYGKLKKTFWIFSTNGQWLIFIVTQYNEYMYAERSYSQSKAIQDCTETWGMNGQRLNTRPRVKARTFTVYFHISAKGNRKLKCEIPDPARVEKKILTNQQHGVRWHCGTKSGQGQWIKWTVLITSYWSKKLTHQAPYRRVIATWQKNLK